MIAKLLNGYLFDLGGGQSYLDFLPTLPTWIFDANISSMQMKYNPVQKFLAMMEWTLEI